MKINGRAVASKDRQLVSVAGWSHYDFYDKPEPVDVALEKLVPYFEKHLNGKGDRIERKATE